MNKILDVSHWDGELRDSNPPSWGIVATMSPDLSGVIIKAVNGAHKEDEMYRFNRQAVQETGLLVGTYLYWLVEHNDLKQALSYARTAFGNSGDYPPILDFEPDPKRYKIIPYLEQRLRQCMEEMDNAFGRQAVIYSGKYYLDYYFPNGVPSWLAERPLWLAAYPKKLNLANFEQWNLNHYAYQSPTLPRGYAPERLWLWQFSCQGKILGIRRPGSSTTTLANVDLNYEVNPL